MRFFETMIIYALTHRSARVRERKKVQRARSLICYIPAIQSVGRQINYARTTTTTTTAGASESYERTRLPINKHLLINSHRSVEANEYSLIVSPPSRAPITRPRLIARETRRSLLHIYIRAKIRALYIHVCMHA